ncbi:hypothetical protein ACROYT_G018824 [Oculina patagonica]
MSHKKSSRISRPPRRPLDDDYTWESLGALGADLAGMSADMAELGRRSSPSSVPSKDSVPQYGASPPPPPRHTNSVPDVELQNLAQAAQAASPNPPQDLDFRRLLLAKETQMIRSKSSSYNWSWPGFRPHRFPRLLTNPLQANRTNKQNLWETFAPRSEQFYPQQWPHILAPGEPKLYNELTLAEFTASYLAIVEKCPDATKKSLFLHHLHDLMSLACTYQWSAVRAFHYKVLRTLELGLAKWGDSFDGFKQPFFLPTNLLPSVGSPSTEKASEKARRVTSQRPPASQQPSRHQICDDWSWYDDCSNEACAKLHICIVCKRPDHQARHCPKLNSGIPKDTYLDAPFSLRLPGTDALQALIHDKGPGCHLFKRDLSRAYRQLRVDPRDYNYLGFRHNGFLYFDIAPPFGLRSAAMMCQRTTSAVTYMFGALGFNCTNYIDVFGGAEISAKSAAAFDTLGTLLSDLGLQSSPDKDSPPATSMVFLGVLFDTLDMSMRVTPDRLSDLLSQCQATLLQQTITIANLRSLLGVMSFVTACVRPARIFMNGLLNALRSSYTSRPCHISDDLKSDLHWWCTFLSQYNGVSIIKIDPWITDPLFLSTDACLTGAGGFFEGYFFHTPFPDFVLSSFGHDINILELLAIMVALKLWGDRLRGKRFLLHCDNANSVLALNSGRSRVPGMQACLREIWFLSALFDFEFRAEHIPDPPQLSLSPSAVPVSLPALSDLTASVQAHAYAPGTLRNLRSQWKSYLSFCSTFGLLPLPASPQTISSYAVFLACFTSSYQTILNKLNGVRLFHLLQNTPCTALDSFEVSLTKKELKRVLGLATHQKSPITPALLLQFKSHLDLTTPADAAIWCLFTVAFFSFLRKSNLTVSSPSSFDPTRHLCRDDIKFTSHGAVLRIKWTKTLQHKDRLLLVPLPRIPGSALCPVSASVQYFTLVPAPDSAPFFSIPSHGSLRPLTHDVFSKAIKSHISSIGLSPSNFSPHSFRRGGATFAFQAGVPERLIQRHGDWRSDAYRRYLSLSLTQRTVVADLMAAGLMVS